MLILNLFSKSMGTDYTGFFAVVVTASIRVDTFSLEFNL